MADTSKLSVEQALKKLRESDAKSQSLSRDDKSDLLNDELKRLRAQRLRLGPSPTKRDPLSER